MGNSLSCIYVMLVSTNVSVEPFVAPLLFSSGVSGFDAEVV